jgi:hypothetical protein
MGRVIEMLVVVISSKICKACFSCLSQSHFVLLYFYLVFFSFCVCVSFFSRVYLVCFALLRVISSKMCQSILLYWEREVAPKAESGEPRPKMWTSWTVMANRQ